MSYLQCQDSLIRESPIRTVMTFLLSQSAILSDAQGVITFMKLKIYYCFGCNLSGVPLDWQFQGGKVVCGNCSSVRTVGGFIARILAALVVEHVKTSKS